MTKSRDLKTDTKTDMMYRYFANESKVKQDKIEDLYRDFDPKKPTLEQEYSAIDDDRRYSSGNVNLALPDDDDDDDEAYNEDNANNEDVVEESSERKQANFSPQQNGGQPFVRNAKAFVETPGERRRRQLEWYQKLMDIKEKYKIKLDRHYTVDDDPDEMQTQYELLFNKRKKEKSVKFYKQLLVGGVGWIESTNENYNPFDFSLEGWAENVQADIDDYNEIVEELYEKYKGLGPNSPPEVRLLIQLTMSAIMFNASKKIFGRDTQHLDKDDDRVQKAREALAKRRSANPNSKAADSILADTPKPSPDADLERQRREFEKQKQEWEKKMRETDVAKTQAMNYNHMLQQQMHQLQMEREAFVKQQAAARQTPPVPVQSTQSNARAPVSSIRDKVQQKEEPYRPPSKKSTTSRVKNLEEKLNQLEEEEDIDDEEIDIKFDANNSPSKKSEEAIFKEIQNQLSVTDLSDMDNSTDAGLSTITRKKKKKPLKL